MRPTTDRPFDYTRLNEELCTLLNAYPFFELTYIGCSVLDRPIPCIRVGHGTREILYVGAHHGMEWITSALLVRFLNDLGISVRKKRNSLGALALCELCTLYVLPMLNPDGIEYQIHGIEEGNPLYSRLLEMNGGSRDFSHWQANARGVDLNHNYDAGFAEYKKLEALAGITEGAPTRYSGLSPESEPEVSALCNFIRFHKNLHGVMTLHTQGEEIFFRSGGKTLPKAERVADRLSALSDYRLGEAEGLASYGGLTDWCVQALGLPAFTLECGKGHNPLPFSALSDIYVHLRDALFSFPTLL